MRRLTMTKVRMWMTAATLAGIVALVYASGSQGAGDDDARVVVDKIAAALKSGDKEGANKLAAVYRKKAETVEDAMDLFKKRDKGGIGFAPGTPKELDGIEVKIREAARDGDKAYAKNAARWQELAWNAAAIGLIGEHFTPKKDMGKKTVKGWMTTNAEMQA